MKAHHIIIVIAAVLALAALVWAWPTLYMLEFLATHSNPGTFDRPRFETIVQRVRAMGISPGQSLDLRLDDIQKSESLRPRKPSEIFERGQGVGCVWAEMTAEGKLKVVIETRDLGHAGEYGFAFLEEQPPKSKSEGIPWLNFAGLPYWILDSKIDEQWWRVLYNLD